MSERKIAFDTATLDQKILMDDDKYLVMPAVIASEIVHQYEDGWAYKPADELETMTQIASDIGSVPIKILEHPGPDTNYLLARQSDVYGRAENFQFVKNLKDPKTGRPMRRGTKADIRWFKDRVPAEVIEKIKTGNLHDVSIGFTFDNDPSPGEYNGVHYDYVQRNIYLNHIAAPIESGRCPGPVCGIGFDQAKHDKTIKVANDPFAEYTNFEDCVAKNQDKENPEAYCAEIKRKTEGDLERDCPICLAIRQVGMITVAKRLAAAYGQDVLEVIKNEKKPKPKAPQEKSLDSEFAKAFGQLKAQLQR